MVAARLPDPTPVLRSLARNDRALVFEDHVFNWVASAAQARPQATWLLDVAYESLTRFGSLDLPIPLTDALRALFQHSSGQWSALLALTPNPTPGHQVFLVPLKGGQGQSLGLLGFDAPPEGGAWRAAVGLAVELYLSRVQQAYERRTLETLLGQVKTQSAALKATSYSEASLFGRLREGTLRDLRAQFERILIKDRMAAYGHVKTATAVSLGITYRSLAHKCKTLHI